MVIEERSFIRTLTEKEFKLHIIFREPPSCSYKACSHNRRGGCWNHECYTHCSDGKVAWTICDVGIAYSLDFQRPRNWMEVE